MDEFIELSRTFHVLNDAERADPELLARTMPSGMHRGIEWKDLLKSERIFLRA